MDKRSFIINLFILLLLGIIVFGLTKYSGRIQSELTNLFSKAPIASYDVKGAATKAGEPLQKAVAEDVGAGLETGKKTILNIKVSDILTVFDRTKKVTTDIKSAIDSLKEQVDTFSNKK